ncbi:MAG: CAP domain-containing protein, partial [Bdellovibrionales bacterium]|nr:CAP domain-containing protein [Bdellovibrionales bacterium]
MMRNARDVSFLATVSLVIFLSACADTGENVVSDVRASELQSNVSLSCEEKRFLRLVNMYRAENGVSALVVSRSATLAARWHARDMGENRYFSHTDSLGRSPAARAEAFGYFQCMGENAAAGNQDAERTFC